MLRALAVLSFLPHDVSTQNGPFPRAEPESQAVSSEALSELGETVRGYFEGDWIVGAELLVIKNRRTVFHEAYGFRNRDKQLPMERDSIFNIRSMTKPITGAALQILIDEGELAPSDRVAEILPAFDNERSGEITVEQVLSHRAGLPLTMLTTRIDEYESLFAMAAAAGEKGPDFEPGSKFWYSDAGTEVVGAMVEELSGMGLDEFVSERILEPLGMSDTFYVDRVDHPRAARMASSYMGGRKGWNLLIDPAETVLYPYPWGSQSLYATPVDYARFLTLWMDDGMAGDERILGEEAIERTLKPASRMSMLGSDARFPSGFRGLHTFYGQMAVLHVADEDPQPATATIIGHNGSDGTWAWAWPELDLIVLYFTQSRGQTTGIQLERVIDRLLVHPGEEEPIPERYRRYLGTYLANGGPFQEERLEVFVQDGRLILGVPSQLPFQLREPDVEGRWCFEMNPSRWVSFEESEDGKVGALQLHAGRQVFEAPRCEPSGGP